MTDTPLLQGYPPSGWDKAQAFIGNIARPFSIIWISLCAGIAMIILAWKLDDPVQAAVFIGAVFATGLTPLYLGKAWENSKTGKQAAEVEIAKAQSETK